MVSLPSPSSSVLITNNYRDQHLQTHYFAAVVDFTQHTIKNDKQRSLSKLLTVIFQVFASSTCGRTTYAMFWYLFSI